MDTVSLWLTGKLLHSEMSTRRVALGASLGALFSTAATVLSLNEFLSLTLGLVSSVLMCLVSFRSEKPSLFLKRVGVLWTVGILLGGVMTMLLSGGVRVVTPERPRDGTASVAGYIPLAILLCALLVFCIMRGCQKRLVKVDLELMGKRKSFSGLVDSGNLLRDPLSGDHVIVLSVSSAERLFTEDVLTAVIQGTFSDASAYIASRYRVIPAGGAGGESILHGIRADSVTISGRRCAAVIALSNTFRFSGEIECIVPAELVS